MLGRGNFAANLNNLILEKGGAITAQDLVDIGNAEDYLRVSSNISSVLEYVLAIQHDYDISQVYTFASTKMPYFAVLLSVDKPVHVYLTADEEAPFSPSELERLQELGCHLHLHRGQPTADETAVVLSTQTVTEHTFSIVDGVIQPNVLFLNNLDTIPSAKILTHRKRMATPITTPAGLRQLQILAGIRYPQVHHDTTLHLTSLLYITEPRLNKSLLLSPLPSLLLYPPGGHLTCQPGRY